MKTIQRPDSYHLITKIWGTIFPGAEKVSLCVCEGDLTSHGYFLVQEVDMKIPLDWARVGDPTAAKIAALKRSIALIRGEAQAAITKVEGEIASFLELEYLPKTGEMEDLDDIPF